MRIPLALRNTREHMSRVQIDATCAIASAQLFTHRCANTESRIWQLFALATATQRKFRPSTTTKCKRNTGMIVGGAFVALVAGRIRIYLIEIPRNVATDTAGSRSMSALDSNGVWRVRRQRRRRSRACLCAWCWGGMRPYVGRLLKTRPFRTGSLCTQFRRMDDQQSVE